MPKTALQDTDMGPAGAENAWRPPHSVRNAGTTDREGDALLQDVAKEWIRHHQNAALLAAFAAGVFVGAWMRG